MISPFSKPGNNRIRALLQLCYSDACVSFAEFTEPEGRDMAVFLQILMNAVPQRACSLAVYNPHLLKVGQGGVVQILVEFRAGFIYGFSQQIDLRRDGEGFADPHFPGGGTIQLVGVGLLLIPLVVVMYNDIARLFMG